MVYAEDLKSLTRKGLWVRLPPSALMSRSPDSISVLADQIEHAAMLALEGGPRTHAEFDRPESIHRQELMDGVEQLLRLPEAKQAILKTPRLTRVYLAGYLSMLGEEFSELHEIISASLED